MVLKHLYYGWILLVIAVVVIATCQIQMYTFGVFVIPLAAEFNWSRGAISSARSISMIVGGPLGLFTGRLSDKYGPRILVTIAGILTGIGFLLLSRINSLWQLFLIYGLFMGSGNACCFIPIMSTIPRWFAEKRGMVIGIAAAGVGLGGVIWPPVAQWIISLHSWRPALAFLGLMSLLIVIPLAQFMKHSPQRIGLRPYGEKEAVENKQSVASAEGDVSFAQAVKTSRFWLLGLIMFCFYFSLHVIIVHIDPYAVDIGVSAAIAASILSIVAGFRVIGNLVIGYVADKIGARLVLSACLITATLALIWLLFAKESWMLYIFAVILGSASGAMVVAETLVPAELFGLSALGVIIGSFNFSAIIGGGLGAPLAGSTFDVTGNYNLAFLTCVLADALAAILSLILLRQRVKRIP